jgi:glycosyltransferase involved in cell wall biosynthesis
MDNRGTSPLRDLSLLLRLWRLLRHERPSLVIFYTVKPNIYGSLAARALGIPSIVNVTGLGAAFIRQSWLTHVVSRLYRLAFLHSRVVFENTADRQLFVDGKLVQAEQTIVMSTTGVDLTQFAPHRPRPPDDEIRFLLIARMLWDKGVGEFVAAARQIRRQVPGARFYLLGFLDVPNPAAIDRATVEAWQAEGVVTYLGETSDVRPAIAAADCIVLPSYREGLSRSLIEAAAMARPIIATDVPGCRDTVDAGISGLLVPPRDAVSLAAAMRDFCALSPAARSAMGHASRLKAEAEFDERHVIARYRDELQRMTNGR